MIRTRDFIIYLFILLFVVLGAVYNGLTSTVHERVALVFFPSDKSTEDLAVDKVDASFNRDERVETLRSKIAAGDGKLTYASPVVDTFVDAIEASIDEVVMVETETISSDSDTAVVSSVRSVQYCNGGAKTISIQGTSITEIENTDSLRLLLRDTSASTTASSSADTKVTVSTLPLRTARADGNTCLPDTLVGVYRAGASWYPLTNEMARSFAMAAPDALIGYSRDGFAIYGPLANDTVLDSCGGTVVNRVYQYHVRTNDLFILGCYASTPAPLAL